MMSSPAPSPPQPAERIGPLRQPGKRILDLVLGLLLLLLAAPLLLLLALLVKLTSPGPAFHRRRVVGRGGEFDAFKLRTMRLDADAWLRARPELQREFSQNFKLRNDPRVTPLGRWLRRTSLDELPQFWNVVRGEMSLVGPRIISPEELPYFGEHRGIFDRVRPGVTGYWQIYARQRVSYQERVAMELAYVSSWSMLRDLQLLLLTPLRVISGGGAY